MADTPILTALINRVHSLSVPLHVPGHKQGRGLPSEFASWLGQAAKLDLTELPGLDNLHAPEGCIAKSEELAASHYGSEHCFYSVNGSTAGVMAAILATAMSGTVLFTGPFHQSAWRGLVLADAEAILMDVDMDENRLQPKAPTSERISSMLKAHPKVNAVYLTSPTYQGAVADVAAIAKVCHDAGVPLLVDEAHGAHFGLIDAFPRHSVACGADVVVQSVHKMLPGLTQTAWVHVQGNRVSHRRLFDCLSSLQTTSPSYLLMASLDVAQAWLHSEGKDVAQNLLAVLQSAGFANSENRFVDPLRHWIPTGHAEWSRHIQETLQQRGIFIEYADAMGVLAVFGFGLTETDVRRYREALNEASTPSMEETAALPVLKNLYQLASAESLSVRPREVFQKPVKYVNVEDASNRISGAMITPYPPGVPMVLPGQKLRREVLDVLTYLINMQCDVHGIRDGKIAVLSE